MLPSSVLSLAFAAVSSAHIIITYPGWRGNNLITNDTYPYGMQWTYPCGGIEATKNRTYWSTEGGAVAFQPGWFRGHETAFAYINMGFGDDGPHDGPKNMSFPMVAPFQILGPSNGPYPGSVCLPQVPLPKNRTVKAGDLATIQVVELAVHGAALYSCVDIIFAEPGDPRIAEVNATNCENSTDIGFATSYTIVDKAVGQPQAEVDAQRAEGDSAAATLSVLGTAAWAPLLAGAAWLLL